MANSTNKQIASGIAALVRGQRFSGSGVWRQSGNATLRIQTQTEAIVKNKTCCCIQDPSNTEAWTKDWRESECRKAHLLQDHEQ